MPDPLADDTDIYTTCPRCGHTGDGDDFDIFGACGDNVFCPKCHLEFDPLTLEPHHTDPCQMCCNRLAKESGGLITDGYVRNQERIKEARKRRHKSG